MTSLILNTGLRLKFSEYLLGKKKSLLSFYGPLSHLFYAF